MPPIQLILFTIVGVGYLTKRLGTPGQSHEIEIPVMNTVCNSRSNSIVMEVCFHKL